jgi:flagellar motor switch protein FliN
MAEETENNENGKSVNGKSINEIEDLELIKIKQIADDIKAGDEAVNKLKIQNLDFILDIPLKVTVELGRTTYLIKDLLSLGQGSVLELDKLAGEPLEILVNGKLVAKGEVVVVNEKFGVRISNIISPVERIETLK